MLVFELNRRHWLGLGDPQTLRLVCLRILDVVGFLGILDCKLFFLILGRFLLQGFLLVCLGCSIGFLILILLAFRLLLFCLLRLLYLLALRDFRLVLLFLVLLEFRPFSWKYIRSWRLFFGCAPLAYKNLVSFISWGWLWF